MPMNQVIQEKRKALGLTQEQVAAYLHVSAPAVNKWEKGTTSPDLALLPALARLLKTDLNTLFGFHEDLSRREISGRCEAMRELFLSEGIGAAYEAACQTLHEYPHNEELLHCLTFQLSGLICLSGLPAEELEPYEDAVDAWFRRLAGSGNGEISNSAKYMLASRYIRAGEDQKAQAMLDEMPDPAVVTAGMADKRMLQVSLYLRQGKGEQAAEMLERELLGALNRAQGLLYRLVDAELAAGDMGAARLVADRARVLAEQFDLWPYNAFVGPLQVAVAERDGEACIPLLRGMLEALLRPWEPGRSPLFRRIAPSLNSVAGEQLLPSILTELEQDGSYDFLRERAEFQALLAAYREKAGEIPAQ